MAATPRASPPGAGPSGLAAPISAPKAWHSRRALADDPDETDRRRALRCGFRGPGAGDLAGACRARRPRCQGLAAQPMITARGPRRPQHGHGPSLRHHPRPIRNRPPLAQVPTQARRLGRHPPPGNAVSACGVIWLRSPADGPGSPRRLRWHGASFTICRICRRGWPTGRRASVSISLNSGPVTVSAPRIPPSGTHPRGEACRSTGIRRRGLQRSATPGRSLQDRHHKRAPVPHPAHALSPASVRGRRQWTWDRGCNIPAPTDPARGSAPGGSPQPGERRP